MTFGMIDAEPESLHDDLEGLDENDPLRKIWELVHDSKETAKKSASFKANDLLAMDGYIPGLPLMKKAGKADYHDLNAGETKRAFDLITSFKPDNSGILKIPRITRDNFDISDSEHVFALLPKYILTNAGVVFKAIYEDSKRRTEYFRGSSESHVYGESELSGQWDEFGNGIKRGNVDDDSGIQKRRLDWYERSKDFLDKFFPDNIQVTDRMDQHVAGLKEVQQVLRLPLAVAKSEDEFWRLMNECMRLTKEITDSQELTEVMIGATDGQMKVMHAIAANIYEDCLKILGVYGDLLRFDGVMSGFVEDRASSLSFSSNDRQRLVHQIRKYIFDAQTLAIEKRILDYQRYRENKKDKMSFDEASIIDYNLWILDCDKRALQIVNRFFEEDVETDEEAQGLRWKLKIAELDRQILTLEKKAFVLQRDGDKKSAYALSRDAVILRIHREILAYDPNDQRYLPLQRKGEVLLLERERDEIGEALKSRCKKLNDKEKHEMTYAYEEKNIEMQILQVDADIDSLGPDEHFNIKRQVLMRHRRKLSNQMKMLNIDKKLNSPVIFLTEGERKSLNAKRTRLANEDINYDMEILAMRSAAVSADASTLQNLCDLLTNLGSAYVKFARNGVKIARRLEEMMPEYKAKLDEMMRLANDHNKKIEEYKKLMKMIKRDKQELLRLRERGRENTEDYEMVQARLEILEEKLSNLKDQLASKSEVINEVRNDINGLQAIIDKRRYDLAEMYSHAHDIIEGGVDGNSYMSLLSEIADLFVNLRQNYPEADEVGVALNEKLVEEIAEGGRQVSLSSVRDQEKDSSELAFRETVQSDPGYRPTMKSERDATYYPVDPSTPEPPKVEVLEVPQSYRKEIHDAVRDLMVKRQREENK